MEFFAPPAFTLTSMRGGGEGGDGEEGESGEEGVVMSYDAVIENDVVKELMSVEGQVNANLRGNK